MVRKWTDDTAKQPPVGPKMGSSQTEIDNKVKLCGSWDHYPVYASIQEDDGRGYLIEKKKKKKKTMRCAGWRPYDKEARTDFKKSVMDQKGDVQPEDLKTIQRGIEEAAEKITHTTPDRQEEVRNAPEEVTVREGAAARCSDQSREGS